MPSPLRFNVSSIEEPTHKDNHGAAVSLRDITNHLGMPIAMVSRALRDKPTVLQETKDRIIQAAEAIRHQRNAYVGERRGHPSQMSQRRNPRFANYSISTSPRKGMFRMD